ncbi:hypothetical protein [Methanimicrococcus hongohii]|uniref:hypothetical protein n=1 Tax=Methanimicrococcus hongohii TaxID=3028295 RepID=UPI00292ED941|nr:hypothetical protein [Methanimicrococcus sp. Hf6]
MAEAEKQLKSVVFGFVSDGKESPTPSFLRCASETRRWRGGILLFHFNFRTNPNIHFL